MPIAASAAKGRRRDRLLLLRWRGGEKEISMVAAMRGINVDDDVEDDDLTDELLRLCDDPLTEGANEVVFAI